MFVLQISHLQLAISSLSAVLGIQCHDTRTHSRACMHASVRTLTQPQWQCNQLRDPELHLQTDTPRHRSAAQLDIAGFGLGTYITAMQTGATIPLKRSVLPDDAPVAAACVASAQIRSYLHPISTLKNQRPAPSISSMVLRPKAAIKIWRCILTDARNVVPDGPGRTDFVENTCHDWRSLRAR